MFMPHTNPISPRNFWSELNRDRLIERQRTADIERWKHNLLRAGLVRCPQEGDPHRCSRSHRQLCGFESLFGDDHLRLLNGGVHRNVPPHCRDRRLRHRVGSHSDTIVLGAHGEAAVGDNSRRQPARHSRRPRRFRCPRRGELPARQTGLAAEGRRRRRPYDRRRAARRREEYASSTPGRRSRW